MYALQINKSSNNKTLFFLNRALYEEQQRKTSELLTNAEQHSKEQEKNAELIKNAEVELEEKEHLLQLKERELSE